MIFKDSIFAFSTIIIAKTEHRNPIIGIDHSFQISELCKRLNKERKNEPKEFSFVLIQRGHVSHLINYNYGTREDRRKRRKNLACAE